MGHQVGSSGFGFPPRTHEKGIYGEVSKSLTSNMKPGRIVTSARYSAILRYSQLQPKFVTTSVVLKLLLP